MLQGSVQVLLDYSLKNGKKNKKLDLGHSFKNPATSPDLTCGHLLSSSHSTGRSDVE